MKKPSEKQVKPRLTKEKPKQKRDQLAEVNAPEQKLLQWWFANMCEDRNA